MEATEEVCAACNGDEFVRRDDGRLDYCDSCQLPPAVRVADALERIAAVQEENLAMHHESLAMQRGTAALMAEDVERRAAADVQAHALAQEAQVTMKKMAKGIASEPDDLPGDPPNDKRPS